jgi:serine/threonine protein kinase
MALSEIMAQLPGFKILATVGRGTTTVVYRAQDLRIDRVVALQVLLSGPIGEREVRAARFLRAAQVMASLAGEHEPNIPALHGVMEYQGRLYSIREFVEGETLEKRVLAPSSSSTDGVRVIATIAGAVARVHARGIVHRNLNPSNVLVESDGTPKLIGFGRVAMQAGPEQRPPGAPIVSPEIDVKALQAMLGWVFSALGQPFPYSLIPALGPVASAEAFAASVGRGL